LKQLKDQVAGFFNAFRANWLQLSKVNILDWKFFGWFPAIHLMTGVAYEESRLGVRFSELVPAILIAEVCFLVSFFGGYWILKRLHPNAFGATGMLVVLIGGSQLIRGLALEIGLVELLEISNQIDLRRLPGDFTLGFLVSLVLAYLQTARAQYQEDTNAIDRIRKELVLRRQQAQTAAAEAEKALRERAQTALLSKLAEIEKLLVKTNLAKSADHVRQLVELEVRPLSKDIWNRLEVLSQVEADPGRTLAQPWPKRIPLRRAYRPALIFLFANLNLIATANALAGAEFAITLLLYSVTMLPIGSSIRRAIPEKFEPAFWPGMLLSLLMTGLSLIPTWLYLFSVAELYPGAVGLRQSGAGLIVLVVLGLGIRAGFAASQERSIARLEELNDQLSREISLIEQSIWIAKRNWSFIVHGTVQGALTVAHTRLNQAGKDKDSVLKLVKGDIERARTALESGLVTRQSASSEFEDLRETWDGVCEIRIQYEPDLLEAVDETSRICTVEIVKEIVGNAFRHGAATKISFQITIEDQRVQIFAVNNGSPVTESTIGLGTDLLNELTESWNITNENEGVAVRAVIPFRRS
jgi:signal transduction histidine kinase